MGSEDIEMMLSANGYGDGEWNGPSGAGRGNGSGKWEFRRPKGDGSGMGESLYGFTSGGGEFSGYGEPDIEREQLSCLRLLTDNYPDINYYLCQLHVINSK